MVEGFQGGDIFDNFPSEIKEGPRRFRSQEKPWEGDPTVNCKQYPPKGDHLTCSICGRSIHEPKVVLQDKRSKLSPGAIWIGVKVWDLFKYTINQVKVRFFGAFLNKDTSDNPLM